MLALLDPPATTAFPAPAQSPQTLDSNWQFFRREIKALEKKNALAGQIERRIQEKSKPLLREAAREAMQSGADACEPNCPYCGAKLQKIEQAERTLATQWGEVTIRRAYGRCPRCREYHAPADLRLGLEANTKASPDMAEKMTYLATLLPPAVAAETFEHITGSPAAPATIQRQTKKKAEEALFDREEDARRALDPDERADFSRETRADDEPPDFTLAILFDGWMIRERDDWGITDALRALGQSPKRWHEVKSARLFRLDWRAKTASERTLLLDSRHVATRLGVEKFSELAFTEAVRLGLLRCSNVLVIADGAVWIWNIVQDRFSEARGTLDFYHASSHLWAIAYALFGEGSDEARHWVEPLLHDLRHGREGHVLKTLSDWSDITRELPMCEDVKRERDYFESHRDHLDYESKFERGEPIGSGAMESACKQYQLRFKRPGQFWNKETEEGLLELVNRRKNGRWNSLWPHLASEN